MNQPNIILVTVDCLRHDYLGTYGRKQSVSPFIDSIANSGTQFNYTYSMGPWTPISFVGLFSSSYLFKLSGAIGLVGKRRSFVEVLQDAGYTTAAFHSNHFLAKSYGYSKGFSEFNEMLLPIGKNLVGPPPLWRKIISNLLPETVKKKIRGRVSPADFRMPYVRGKEITEKAIEWINKPKSKPYFLWVHYMDVHEPMIPLDPLYPKDIDPLEGWAANQALRDPKHSYTSEEIRILTRLYETNLSYIDDLVKKMFSTADANDGGNSLKIITADHGQAFNEHGFVGHGIEHYEELIHVPLIVNGPDIPSKQSNSVTSLIDIAPTLLNYANIKPLEEYEGVNLFSDIEDDRTVFCEEGRKSLTSEGELMAPGSCFSINDKSISCMWKNFKYIRRHNNQEIVFDIKKDPLEKTNIIDGFKEIEFLRKKVAEHESIVAPAPKPEYEMTKEETEELKERLKQLGYM